MNTCKLCESELSGLGGDETKNHGGYARKECDLPSTEANFLCEDFPRDILIQAIINEEHDLDPCLRCVPIFADERVVELQVSFLLTLTHGRANPAFAEWTTLTFHARKVP